MFQFLKKHAAAAKEGAPPEGAAPVCRSAGDRLDSSLAVSVGLCVLVFIVLPWMGSYSPHWGKSIWHQVSEAFLLFSVTLALMPMYWLCAGSLRRKNKTFVVTWEMCIRDSSCSGCSGNLCFHGLSAEKFPLVCLPYRNPVKRSLRADDAEQICCLLYTSRCV